MFVISGSHCKQINVGYATKYSNFCHLWRTLFCADLGSEFYTSNVKTFYIVRKYKKVHPLLSDHYFRSKFTTINKMHARILSKSWWILSILIFGLCWVIFIRLGVLSRRYGYSHPGNWYSSVRVHFWKVRALLQEPSFCSSSFFCSYSIFGSVLIRNEPDVVTEITWKVVVFFLFEFQQQQDLLFI